MTKETSNEVFIEGHDASIRHILRLYWPQTPLVDLADIALRAESLLSILKEATGTPNNNQEKLFQGQTFQWKILE